MTRLCATWRQTPVVVQMTSGCQREANKYRHASHETRYVVIYACSNLMNSLWDIHIFLGLVPKESPCRTHSSALTWLRLLRRRLDISVSMPLHTGRTRRTLFSSGAEHILTPPLYDQLRKSTNWWCYSPRASDGGEDDPTCTSGTQMKRTWSSTTTTPQSFMTRCLSMRGNNFIFTSYLGWKRHDVSAT